MKKRRETRIPLRSGMETVDGAKVFFEKEFLAGKPQLVGKLEAEISKRKLHREALRFFCRRI